MTVQQHLFWKAHHMEQKNKKQKKENSIVHIVTENLKLTPKQAKKFAQQATALSRNLILRQQQLQRKNHYQNKENLSEK